ncbi:hypothetical protein B7494_g8045 [Chlorociboria aeruginascens]|nr:hypothetical protein B7494_g8045 [Chlorociboria aeruginascens]
MFILTKIEDLVQIHPEDLGKDTILAIEDNINAKYANKVIQKIGLCICFYDLLYASDGQVGHGNGLVSVNVEFRLIVFRPFKGEVMIGKISSATQQGIRIRTHFFDEIFVPHESLPEGCYFDHGQQLFIWEFEGVKLYFDNQEKVRFRVNSENWFDQSPIGPSEKEDGTQKKSPYTIEADMKEAGLGPCLWWDGDGE